MHGLIIVIKASPEFYETDKLFSYQKTVPNVYTESDELKENTCCVLYDSLRKV